MAKQRLCQHLGWPGSHVEGFRMGTHASFFTAVLMKPMPSVIDRMKSRSGSFLRHLSVSFLSGLLLRFVSVLRLVSDVHLSAEFTCQIIYDIQFSVSFHNVVSDFQLFSVVICQIPSHLMFISWSPFSVSSQTLDRTWLNTNTAHITLTPPSCIYFCILLVVFLYPSRIPQQSDLAVYLVYSIYTVWKRTARPLSSDAAS